MSILDEAIREHLELKRQHGAADSELKQLEDDAFGPAERPGAATPSDAAAEAPTEFMSVPEDAAPGVEEGSSRRDPSQIADLQEPPPESPAEEEEPVAEEEQSATEHETVEPSQTEERQAIAEQATQHFDVEEELAASAKAAPSDEELVERQIEEPRLAPVDPLAIEDAQDDGTKDADEQGEDDEFWDDRRLSEELDQALEAPVTEARDLEPVGEPEPAAEAQPLAPPEPAEAPEPVAETEPQEDDEEQDDAPQSRSDSDLLEDTPDFLEDAPEDDQLWFEQKPPKDFDFDD